MKTRDRCGDSECMIVMLPQDQSSTQYDLIEVHSLQAVCVQNCGWRATE